MTLMFSPENVVTRYILERHARTTPDAEFIRFEDGSCWTYRQALEISYAAANVLRQAGLRQDDRIGILYGNGPEFIRAWWGAAALGVQVVPINIGYRGRMLEHLLRLSRLDAVVGDPQLMDVFSGITEPGLVPERKFTANDLLSTDITAPALQRPIETWDIAFYLLTSGTTGPSKLAIVTYRNIHAGVLCSVPLSRGYEDCALIDIPLFHGGALRLAMGALSYGARMAILAKPRMSTYWQTVKETGATLSFLVSTMVDFVLAQPVSRIEREHSLRILGANPLPSDPQGFMERFGVQELLVAYGSTEAPGMLRAASDDPLARGYCGRARPGYHYRIVDENDIERPAGEPGELIVRHDEPWVISPAYVDNPAASAAVWRNGWFHTGDLLRRDEAGRFFYIDRVKDSLRRRGENISSAEVEYEVKAFPGITEAACVAYRMPNTTDDEVKVWIVPEKGQHIDHEALLKFCVERMPYFMVPRFFEMIDELPKTPSQKILKFDLRERGNSARTWDREAHGFRLTRTGLSKTNG
ncbi:crotonobetaine/carnitine-CoA ligase [Steroidobacter denitrificans]|uniref:Crotonobetaine/carnitine-CoA ligase n=2 Tax=Steroidobacter denitrificans TaxID=465721 RepID=A0A127FDP7_STEDE|nr:crotonobetaine/carnitine-CoA ligase [Steroidobacter denitrificans]